MEKTGRLLNEMVAFAEVVTHGGFSQAARALEVEPSSMSRSVARLEKALKGKLLQRGTRSISLTELGEKVLAECQRIRAAAEDVQSMAGHYGAAPAGLLRLSAPVVFGQVWLAPRLPAFLAAYPDIDLRLTLTDHAVDLVDERVDAAIRIAAELPQELSARRLCATPYVLIASPGYLLDHGAPAHPRDLPSHRCLHLGYGSFGATWPLRRGDERHPVAVGARLAISNSLALATVVEGGTGIGLVPAFSARAGLDAGRLVQVLSDWQLDGTYARSAWLLHAPGAHLAPKVRAFIDHFAALSPA